MLSSQHKEEISRKRYIVKETIDVLIPYGRQNIAIGGHTEDKSNYMAILRHVSKHDEILQSHLDNPVPNTKMIYTDIYRKR
jgi:hypothetical protein